MDTETLITTTTTPQPTQTPSPMPTATTVPQNGRVVYVYDGDGRGLCTPERREVCAPERSLRVGSERGNLVKSIIEDVVTYYPNGAYELKVSGSNEVITKYYSAGSSRIAYRINGEITWLLNDHLGSTVGTVDADGELIGVLKYTAYGELRTGSSTTDYRYTGQREESEIGFYYYVARIYDPAVGRFISADTIVPDPGSSQGYDRYGYVNGNPISRSDPSGHMEVEGCGEDGKQACSPSIEDMAKWENRQCDSGNSLYCSYAEEHPGETAAFIGVGLGLAGIGGVVANSFSISLPSITLGSSTVSAACADGDCTNEIGATGKIGESLLRQFGGISQQYFKTSQGARYIDQFIKGVAYESKVGYVSLTQRISEQVAKDSELLLTSQVDSVVWVFTKSPITGLIGPSEPLFQLLEQNYIQVMFH